MAQQRSLSIILPEDTLQFLRSKVESGEYSSESDVILDRLEAFRSETEEQAQWERDILLPAYDRVRASPSSAISIETVEKNLQARRIQRANLKNAS